MTEHRAQASLTLVKSAMYIPHLQDAFAELVLGRKLGKFDNPEWFTLDAAPRSMRAQAARRLAPIVIKGLAPIVGLVGIRLTERQRLDLFEEFIKGRFYHAGGAALGDYAEDQIMGHLFKNTAMFATPASLDVHLYTAATSDANSTGTEVSGGSYAAENVAAAGWAAISGGATSNSADTDFGTATANWGTISHVSIEVVSTANRLFHGALSSSKTVNNGDSFRFAAGDLDCAVS